MVPFSALLASAFSLGILLRYAHVTMSIGCRFSFFATSCPSASAVGTAPLPFALGPPLPLASPSAGGAAVCRRSGQACGPSWQTSSRNANASMSGGRRLSHFAGTGSFRSALALCVRLASHGSPARSATTARPNPAVEGTSGKRSLPVPRRLRPRAAPQLRR